MKIHKNIFSKKECLDIISFFNKAEKYQNLVNDKRYWINPKNIDNNIFDKLLNLDCNYALEKINQRPKHQIIMINKTIGSKVKIGSGQGWHRDSILKYQQKTIAYLVDVNEKNGPFETCDFKNLTLSRILLPFRRIPVKLFTIYRKIFSLKSNLILMTSGNGFSSNTNFIHQGRPPHIGEFRYAITVYSFFDNEIPKHIKSLCV